MRRSGSEIGWSTWRSSPAALTVWSQLGRDWGFLAVTVLALAFIPFAGSIAPWGTSILLLLAACTLSYQIAGRWVGDCFLLWTVLGSLALRSILSLGFYLISLWEIPIFESLQVGEGFWSFAPDAAHHHAYAVRIVEAWRDGIELPEGLHRGWYFLILATVYKLMGSHPLHGIFFNTVIGVASAFMAYLTARRLGGADAGRVAAVLVAFWPSLVLWSTQLLKEQITVFYVLLAFHFAVGICQEMMALDRRHHAWIGHLLLLAGGTGSVFLIAIARPLYSLAFAFSALLILGAWAVLAFSRRQVYRGGILLLAAILMLDAAFLGQSVDLLYHFFSPRTPWVGHLALGIRYLEEGDRQGAEKEFRRSGELNPRFVPAYEKLVPLLAKEGRLGDIATILQPFTQMASISWEPKWDSLAQAGQVVMKVRPLHNHIIVQRLEEGGPQVGNIIIPDTAKKKPQLDKVIAVGKGKTRGDGKLVPLDVKEGDTILFGGYSGQAIKLDGEECLIMREDEVLAVVESGAVSLAGEVVGRDTLSIQGIEPGVAEAEVPSWEYMLLKVRNLPATILGFSRQLVEFPKTISALRDGQMAAAGHSQIYPEADLSSFPKIFAYLPKGLAFTFFAPFPWQTFDTRGVAGILKTFSLMEMPLIYLLFPFGFIGSWTLIRSGNASGWFLLVYFLIGVVVLALTMVNLGNLFRYRLPFVLALFFLASLGGLPEVLQRVKARLVSLVGQKTD